MSRSRIPRARRNLSIRSSSDRRHAGITERLRYPRAPSPTARRARMEVAGCVRKHGEVAEQLNAPVLKACFFAAV